MKWIGFIIQTILIFAFACSPQPNFDRTNSVDGNFDLYIFGGKIVDGTGVEPFVADVLIRGDTITYIGQVDSSRVTYSAFINAKGALVTPGFIDTHAHGDPLFGGEMRSFLSMGVTTIVLGQDGFHPTKKLEDRSFSLPEWLDSLESNPAQLNVAMLAGHSTIRSQAGVSYDEDPTENQLVNMGLILQEALDAGCFGISTGLEYVEAINAKEDELIYLAGIVGENDGIMMSHMRNEDDSEIDQSIDELLMLGNYCKVHASHLKVVYGKGEKRANEILEKLEAARATDVKISADIYPYLASYTTIGILFPEWAKTTEQFMSAKALRKEELENFLFRRVNQRNGPEATLLADNQYAGKTLAQAAKENNLSFVDLLMQLGPRGGSGAYFIMEDTLVSTLIAHPMTMICSDGSPTMRHPRGHGTFARIIEKYVMERNQLSIQEAIRKMTSLPAATVSIEKRGQLRVGNYADVLIFDPEEVKENATYIDPYLLASGFQYVIINGKMVVRNDSILSTRNGRMLRK